jgi:acyl-CoA-binding protein
MGEIKLNQTEAAEQAAIDFVDNLKTKSSR